MNPERWQRVKEVLDAALELPVMESLLAASEDSDSFLEKSPVAQLSSDEAEEPKLEGRVISHYRILEEVGRGGMGVVYRAMDTHLNRPVALKVLPHAFVEDKDRLQRFEREARVLASLNHPNIATIHEIGHLGEVPFLVLELVPGETLADALAKSRRLPLEEALPLFKQIAEALEAAHDRKIIHRDLKPANVKITPDGKAKVLDFGLAKAFEEDAAAGLTSATASVRGTKSGIILGTATYMSPEQARGKRVDQRTDIWAFGCCLYETLVGEPLFRGATISDTIAQILSTEPDWEALPETTPESIRRVLRRCLNKDPQRRFRDVWDIRVELEEVLNEPAWAPKESAAEPASVWQRMLPWVAAGVFGLAAAGVGLWSWMSTTPASSDPVTRLTLSTPPLPKIGQAIAISPDGTRLAFIAEDEKVTKLFLRSMDQLDAQPIDGTEGASWHPFFSPDGNWIGFVANDKLKKVAVAGGTPVTLCNAPHLRGAVWGLDNQIYFRSRSAGPGVTKVSDTGGTSQIVSKPEDGKQHYPLEALPGGNDLLVARAGRTWSDDPEIGVLSLGTGEYRTLIEKTLTAHHSPTGHLVFAQGGRLLAAPFNTRRLEVTGPSVPVLEGVRSSLSSFANFALGGDGTLIYVPGSAAPRNMLVWVNREGEAQPVTDERRPFGSPRISPDGRRTALDLSYDFEGNADIWVYDLPRETLTRLTLADARDGLPVWSPDSRRVAFQSNRDDAPGLFWKTADGSGATERLTQSDAGFVHRPLSFSPDGSILAFMRTSPTYDNDIYMLSMKGERKAEPFLATPFREEAAQFSPDGKWIAYTSDETGRYEVYVGAYPGPGGRYQISTEGGVEPLWSKNGKELFYRADGKLWSVALRPSPRFTAGVPTVVFEDNYGLGLTWSLRDYDVSHDGQRFLMIQPERQAGLREIVVVLNWFQELNRLVPSE
jgi:serine/threonine-protein kinase